MKQFYTFLFLSCFTTTFIVAQNCPQRYSDKVFNAVHVQYNINYGGLRQHIDGNSMFLAADLYEPKGDTAALRPLVFMIHGGAFLDLPVVTKQSPDIVELANDMARRGYVVVSPDYRLAKDPTALNSIERMAQTVISGMVDINDAICFFVESVSNGNPYRIDTSRIFVGGVSAGAVLSLQGLYVDDTAELDPFYRNISNNVAAFDHRNMEEMLKNKFCGARILGGIGVSGALLDSNFVKYKSTALLLIHGTADPIVPYGVDRPFSLPTLPIMYGSGALYDKIQRSGTYIEFDSYPGLGHVPFMWLDPSKWIQGSTITIWNVPVFDSTKSHMAHFCYRMMGSPETRCSNVTSVKQNKLGNVEIYPNPNKGNFTVNIPKTALTKKWQLQIFSVNGQLISEKEMPANTEFIINEKLPSGLYFIKLSSQSEDVIDYYLGKFTVGE